jgi:hypothetical protein
MIRPLSSFGADLIENTASKIYFIVAFVHCLEMALVLLQVTQLLPSNGGFSGFPVFGLEKYTKIYYIYHRKHHVNPLTCAGDYI